MMENERYPLFTNAEDTYESSKEWVELLKKRTPKELLEFFGCTWEDYVPRVYKKKEKDEQIKD